LIDARNKYGLHSVLAYVWADEKFLRYVDTWRNRDAHTKREPGAPVFREGEALATWLDSVDDSGAETIRGFDLLKQKCDEAKLAKGEVVPVPPWRKE
jgi:hypothetical protein